MGLIEVHQGKYRPNKNAFWLVVAGILYTNFRNFENFPVNSTRARDGRKYEQINEKTNALHVFEPRREKSPFCMHENKDEGQLRGNREADQRLCFRHTECNSSTF